MLKDRLALDLPLYDGLLAGHYVRGQGYGRRRPGGTDDWLLVMTLAGEGRFGTSNGDYLAGTSSVVLVAPGTTHDYGTARSAERWEILWVHFQPPSTWLELLHWPAVGPGHLALTLTDSVPIANAFWEVLRLSAASIPNRKRFAMNALERLLLLCHSTVPSGDHLLDPRVLAVVDYIHANLHGTLALNELSSVASLSESRFAHLFRGCVGMAPRQYVLLQRIQRARTLLERTTLGIAEVAAEVGMEPFYFSLRFRADTGMSPTAFRLESRWG